jgi:hypothetical protein
MRAKKPRNSTKAKKAKKPTKATKPVKPKPRAASMAPSLADCDLLYEGVTEDDRDVRGAVQALMKSDSEILRAAEPHVVGYCNDFLAHVGAAHRPKVELRSPGDVWKYVQLGGEMMVSRRSDGDSEDGVYFSLECECDWDREHGLQLVIRDGRAVTKVGGFDGHLTNADAYGDPALVGVVYVPIR